MTIPVYGTGDVPDSLPFDAWTLVDTRRAQAHDDVTSTLFAVSNGYIGIRDQSGEACPGAPFGTFVNGVHETWTIRYPENAHALARAGQTMVPVHDCLATAVLVDGEIVSEFGATVAESRRTLDLRSGVASRRVRHRLDSGVVIEVSTERLVSLTERRLASIRTRVAVLEGSADIVLHPVMRTRGAEDVSGDGSDPRRSRGFRHRVLDPLLRRSESYGPGGARVTMVDRCHNSGVTVGCSVLVSGRLLLSDGSVPLDATEVEPLDDDEIVRLRVAARVESGHAIEVTRHIGFHTTPAGALGADHEIASRAESTATTGAERGFDDLVVGQRKWLDAFFDVADVLVDDAPELQLAIRWHLFHLAQAGANVEGTGIPAKALTADGYEGHYFWDTEVYLVPFLARTLPDSSRRLIEFRHRHLDAARRRAREMSQRGALFPWRTINGEEASAYYPAGTAQYHIDAAVIHALDRHHAATGDDRFLTDIGAELLVETARLWEDLGFHGPDGRFHIHRVTGPDEYSAVVNDNAYTNIMARFNLRWAADVVDRIRVESPEEYARLVGATGIRDDEVTAWRHAAETMAIPHDEALDIHEQDDAFLQLEPWDFAGTPADRYPLLLHFHPLVIYRHRVLKQADVVLAMMLRDEEFDLGQRRRNFDFYDPLTTGDSSLSACVQATVAAQVGRTEAAVGYFRKALMLDLDDTHGNTVDGVHIANSAGVWAALVHGFAGIRFRGDSLVLEPPPTDATGETPWSRVEVGFLHRGTPCRISRDADSWTVHNRGTAPLMILTTDHSVRVNGGETVTIEGHA